MQVIWCYDELLFLKINRIPPTAVWGVHSNSFFYVEGVGTPSWCAEYVLKLGPSVILRLVDKSKYFTKLNRYIVVVTFSTVLPKTPFIKPLLLKRL